jgi:alkylhydroperoxidase family enzyme
MYEDELRWQASRDAPVRQSGQPFLARKRPPQPGSFRPTRIAETRVAPVPPASFTQEHRQLIAKHAAGDPPGSGFRTLLHLPELVDGVYTFNNYILRKSSLEPRHRLLLTLRTAWLLNNEYIWCDTAQTLAGAAPDADIRRCAAIGADATGLSPVEATLIRLADELFRNTFVSDATWRELARHYSMFNLFDALMTVADITCVGLIFNSLGVQPDPGISVSMPDDVPYRVAVPERESDLTEARIAPLGGPGLAITRTFAHYPALAEPRNAGSAFVMKHSRLSARHREILILRTGWNTQSEYEWAQHVGTVGKARQLGLDPTDIALGLDAEGWNAGERVLIQTADELYTESVVSDQTWALLKAQFNLQLTLSIIATVANYRMVCIALNALGVQIDPEERERLPSDGRLFVQGSQQGGASSATSQLGAQGAPDKPARQPSR